MTISMPMPRTAGSRADLERFIQLTYARAMVLGGSAMCIDASTVSDWILSDDVTGEKIEDLVLNTPLYAETALIAFIHQAADNASHVVTFLATYARKEEDGTRRLYIHNSVYGVSDNYPCSVSMRLTDSDTLPSTPEDRDLRRLYYDGHDTSNEEYIPSRWEIEVALVTLAMLNVKNIGTELVPIPRHIRRQTAKASGQDMASLGTSYHVLTLRPFRANGKGESGEGEKGASKRLHMVRGHFSTYGEHNKLFGRYTGTFWVPTHARGNAERGEVVKSYRIDSEAA